MSASRRIATLFQKHSIRTRIYSVNSIPILSLSHYNTYCSQQHKLHCNCNIFYCSKLSFSSQAPKIQQEEDSDDEDDEYEDDEYEDDEDENDSDENDSETEPGEHSEEDEEQLEEEGEFEYGIDSDDEFTENLEYDVRDDPWWDEMLPVTQQKYLFQQRHKNPDAWAHKIIPHAVKTSNFDKRVIKAVKRYPNLAGFSQCYTHDADGQWRWNMDNVKLNTAENVRNGILSRQPDYVQTMHQIHNREVKLWKNKDIDYRVKSGDIIRLTLYTNLQKQTTQTTTALCLMCKRKGMNSGSIMIRNVEKDGLTVIRQYPLHSPWIKSLQITHRYKVKRRKLYYMYKAPANITDPVKYGDSIGVRSRHEHFKWIENTEEGMKYARDYRLKRRMYFHGMRYRQPWARRLADLYYATAITKNMKGPYKNARREMKYRLRLKPHKIA